MVAKTFPNLRHLSQLYCSLALLCAGPFTIVYIGILCNPLCRNADGLVGPFLYRTWIIAQLGQAGIRLSSLDGSLISEEEYHQAELQQISLIPSEQDNGDLVSTQQEDSTQPYQSPTMFDDGDSDNHTAAEDDDAGDLWSDSD